MGPSGPGHKDEPNNALAPPHTFSGSNELPSRVGTPVASLVQSLFLLLLVRSSVPGLLGRAANRALHAHHRRVLLGLPMRLRKPTAHALEFDLHRPHLGKGDLQARLSHATLLLRFHKLALHVVQLANRRARLAPWRDGLVVERGRAPNSRGGRIGRAALALGRDLSRALGEYERPRHARLPPQPARVEARLL